MSDLPGLVREYIREELRGTYTMNLARVESVDDQRRATVSFKHDPDAEPGNVPIAAPYARDGAGDVLPVQPGDEGVVLHAQRALDAQLRARGPVDVEDHRQHDPEDAVFIPAMVWYDDDQVPDHTEGDRIIAHPSGTVLRLGVDGSVNVTHPAGASVDVLDPESDDRPDAAGTAREQQWPRGDDTTVRVQHPNGTAVHVSRQGVSIDHSAGTPGGNPDRDTVPHGSHRADEPAQYAHQHTLGRPTDPWRVELDGHRHTIPEMSVTDTTTTSETADGSQATYQLPHGSPGTPISAFITPTTEGAAAPYWRTDLTDEYVEITYQNSPPNGTALAWNITTLRDSATGVTGEPLPHRRLMELFVDDAAWSDVVNRAGTALQNARAWFQDYFAWLDAQTTEPLSPAIPRTPDGDPIPSWVDGAAGDAWPYPEHAPSPGARAAFGGARARRPETTTRALGGACVAGRPVTRTTALQADTQ